MWPWGHLAVGFLGYAALARWRDDRPGDAATLAVAVGTQFPDLVDKPLAWVVHLLPSGRSFAHSLLTATAICVVVGMYARRHGRLRVAVAFAVGYVSHLAADAVSPLLAGQFQYVAYLGWPVLRLPSYDTSIGLVGHVTNMEFSPYFVFQIALFVLAVWVWLRDGRPGLSVLRGWFVSWRRTAEH